ncbi:MAG: hypothetical protein AABO41_20540 [Acidobacteriota bacterium]
MPTKFQEKKCVRLAQGKAIGVVAQSGERRSLSIFQFAGSLSQ